MDSRSRTDPETCSILADNGFCSKKAIRRLTPVIMHKHFAKSLPLGQLLLLEGAIEDLQKSQSTSVENQPTHKDTSTVRDQEPVATKSTGLTEEDVQNVPLDSMGDANLDYSRLCNLLGVNRTTSTTNLGATSTDDTGKPGTFDPFQFYDNQQMGTGKSKARDIRDFIMFTHQTTPSNHEQNSGITVGDFQINVAPTNKKVSLEKITQIQYMEGSLRILREMILADKANPSEILAYVGYLTKIVCMAQAFPWQGVIKYDTEYRKQQAALGFTWGSDSPFLMQLLLNTERYGTDKPRETTRRTLNSKFNPSTGTAICQKFNGRLGCSFKNCRYSHACMKCYNSGHGEFNHIPRVHNSDGERDGNQPRTTNFTKNY